VAYAEETQCCALSHLQVHFRDNRQRIEEAVAQVPLDDMTTFFAVTTPSERKLATTLKRMGFKHIHSFNRRRPIMKNSGRKQLKMWIKSYSLAERKALQTKYHVEDDG
jgi:hypothetical protein